MVVVTGPFHRAQLRACRPVPPMLPAWLPAWRRTTTRAAADRAGAARCNDCAFGPPSLLLEARQRPGRVAGRAAGCRSRLALPALRQVRIAPQRGCGLLACLQVQQCLLVRLCGCSERSKARVCLRRRLCVTVFASPSSPRSYRAAERPTPGPNVLCHTPTAHINGACSGDALCSRTGCDLNCSSVSCWVFSPMWHGTMRAQAR